MASVIIGEVVAGALGGKPAGDGAERQPAQRARQRQQGAGSSPVPPRAFMAWTVANAPTPK